MGEMSVDASILLAGRILGTLLFGVAVIGKLRHHEEFVGVVANYRIVPWRIAAPMAWLVIVLEAFVTLALASGVASSQGAACAVVLLWLFAMAITINLVRGRTHIDCGCFQSALRQPLSVVLVLRNLALIALLIPLALAPARHSISFFQLLNGIGAGLVLFALYQVSNQLFALRDSAAALRKRFT